MKNDIEIKEKALLIAKVFKKQLNYKFSLEDVFSSSRDKELVTIRSIIAHCLRKRNYSFLQIGRVLNRNHATIIHLKNHFEKNVDKNRPPFKGAFTKVEFLLSRDSVVKELRAEEVKLNKIEERLKTLRIQIAQMYFEYENL